jgi:hypothetical protein
MAGIGTTSLYINVPTLPRDEFELYSTRLFDDWEAHVSNVLKLPDYSLALEVEEGSIKALGKIAATLGVLYVGIGQYGSFITGVQAIQNQVRTAGDYLAERAADPFGTSPKIAKRGESLARLQTLFVRVQRRELTVEEAMEETEAIFGSELETVPDFVNDLRDSLNEAPLYPEQTELELVDTDGFPLMPSIEKKKRTRTPTPSQPMPDPDQYRVEIWRENRRSKRNVRVIKLD